MQQKCLENGTNVTITYQTGDLEDQLAYTNWRLDVVSSVKKCLVVYTCLLKRKKFTVYKIYYALCFVKSTKIGKQCNRCREVDIQTLMVDSVTLLKGWI